MERRVFYTMIGRGSDSSLTAEEKVGYEMEIHGMEFYAYVDNIDTVYIIDPKSGLSVHRYENKSEQYKPSFPLVTEAKMELEEHQAKLEKIKELRETQVYQEAVSRFERCKFLVSCGLPLT